MIGYVFQGYLKEVPKIQIEKINLFMDDYNIIKGKSKKINVEILPKEAKNHEIEYISSNTKIAEVDSDGNIFGISSGNVTITVKSKENNVSGSIDIKVYTPVTDMEINAENLTLQVQDKFIITPIIIPSDADNKNVIYELQNNEIAQIDDSGTITAIKEGDTKIIIKTEDGNITKEIKIIVVPKLNNNEIKFDDSLKVNENEISGLNIKENNVSKIKNLINTNYFIQIYDYNGQKLSDEDYVGTGCTIRVIDENNIIKMEYQIIVYGDVNGDGKINSTDLLVLQRHILEIEKLQGIFIKAGNIKKNGKNPSSLDSLLIQRHILELKLIDQ